MGKENKFLLIILLVGITANIIITYISYDASTKTISRDSLFQIKIDSLNKRIDSLDITNKIILDSINNSDSSLLKIQENYEENRNRITTLGPDSQYRIFTDYINKH